MQIQTLKRLIMLSVLGVLTTVSAYAQAGNQFTVTIPFNFSVGGKALAPGQYHVGRSTQTSAEGLMLRGTDGRAGAFVLTRRIKTGEVQQQSKLIFRRYGNQYFLAEVWISGASNGRGLPLSRSERQVAQEIAKNGGKSQKVSLVGDQR